MFVKNFDIVNFQYIFSLEKTNFRGPLGNNEYGGITSTIHVRLQDCGHINYLEHVVVTVKVEHPARGEMQLNLKSPFGTKSTLLDFRWRDKVEYSNL